MPSNYSIKPISNATTFAEKAEKHIGVFGSEKWLSVYGSAIQLFGIFQSEEKLIGGFYFLKTKKAGVSFLKLPPYTPNCGLFFESNHQNKSAQNNFKKELMNLMCDFIESHKSQLVVLAVPSTITDLQPFIWNNYKVIPNYTYRIDLNNPLESIVSNFDAKHRNAIQKAIKENSEVGFNQIKNEDLFHYFKQHLLDVGANVYENELKNIFLKFADEKNSFSVTAKKNNEVLGQVFCIYDFNTCYYLFGAVNKKSGIQGINNLLVLKCIEKAKELNCTIFDFEGSMLKGVEKFFRGFGGDLIPYFTINKATLPIELALKFKKRSIF